MSRRYDTDTLSAEENRCLPLRATRPAVLFLGSGEPAIPEPRGVDKPKHPTTKFIVAYMQLYVGEVFADAQMDKYLGKRGQSNMNAVFRDVIYGLYTLKNGDIRKLSYRDWTHMIRNAEATFGELRCFDGSWAARWMITRTWSSRKRNQHHRNQAYIDELRKRQNLPPLPKRRGNITGTSRGPAGCYICVGCGETRTTDQMSDERLGICLFCTEEENAQRLTRMVTDASSSMPTLTGAGGRYGSESTFKGGRLQPIRHDGSPPAVNTRTYRRINQTRKHLRMTDLQDESEESDDNDGGEDDYNIHVPRNAPLLAQTAHRAMEQSAQRSKTTTPKAARTQKQQKPVNCTTTTILPLQGASSAPQLRRRPTKPSLNNTQTSSRRSARVNPLVHTPDPSSQDGSEFEKIHIESHIETEASDAEAEAEPPPA